MISVIMPAYNSGRYIKKAIASVLGQTVGCPLELIIINDGSTDGTQEAVLEFADRNETKGNAGREIVYINNEKNIGVAESRNRGIRRARGSYIAFLDADDWWTEDKLEKQLELIEKKQAVLCATGRELMNDSGESTGRVISVPEVITYGEMLRTNSVSCSSVLMRTEVAREFYMCRDDLHEDYILWLRVLRKYHSAVGIDEPLLKYRLSPGGKSRNKLRSAVMQFGVYRYMKIGWLRTFGLMAAYAFGGMSKYMGFSGKKSDK